MSLWESLVAENPMLIEVRRYRRRMLGSGRSTGLNVAFLTLGAVCYVGLLMIVGSANGSIPAGVVVIIQTGVFTLAAPAVLNNAIAGEREKRTWDLLLVAPVSKAQIMMGKFAGAMTNLMLGAALFLLPMFICAVSYQRTDYGLLALSELDSLSFAVFACALTLLFSARCRRGFTALGMSLGMLLLGLVVYPILLASLGALGATSEILLTFHPFVLEGRLMGSGAQYTNYGSSAVGDSILQIGVFIGLAVALLVWTERTLTFSDNDVKFLPRSR